MRRIFLALALCVVPLSALAQSPIYGNTRDLFWTGFSNLLASNSVQGVNWPATFSQGGTITNLSIVVTTAPATGCTTFPVFGIYDVTAAAALPGVSVTLTTSAGLLSTGAISVPIPAGHQIRPYWLTADVGCTTHANSINWMMVYR